MTINIQFVYGAGNDTAFGGGLRFLQDAVKTKFKDKVYSPRIIDWTEYETLLRLLRKWNDPTILVGHSCGCNPITHAAVALSMERIPYLLAIAPSIFCPVAQLPPNVGNATQATSWWGDFFNPGGRMLLRANSINNKTKINEIYTGASHLNAPYSKLVLDKLLSEVEKVV